MVEVISLLSSPPGTPVVTKKVTSSWTSPEIHHDFEDELDIDFLIEQPSKKRKVSSTRIKSISDTNRATTSIVDVFELSSDIDIPASILPEQGKRTKIAAVTAQKVDDIVFSSSAPVGSSLKTLCSRNVTDLFNLSSDDDGLPDDPLEGLFSASQPAGKSSVTGGFSKTTSNILANLPGGPLHESSANARMPKPKARDDKTSSKRKARQSVIDDIIVSSPAKSQPKKQKGEEAALRKAAKEAEKEAQKERKAVKKAEKEQQKQKAADLAEVNKSKVNKKDAVAEMLVELSSEIQDTSAGNQLEEHMKKLEVPLTYFEQPVTLDGDAISFTDLGAMVRWRRKITAVYDEDAGQWKPTERTSIKQEQHVLVYLKAQEFAMIAAGYSGPATVLPPSESLMLSHIDQHVVTLRSRYPDCTIIYLIEGLQAWLKKNQNARNREYAAAVRTQAPLPETNDAPSASQSKPRKRKTSKLPQIDLSFVTDDVSENLLLHMQLHHKPISIQHTTSATTSALQILAFTQHLSTRPYRMLELNTNLRTASFCMATGQVRTGDDAQDTYIKMLQVLERVTPSIAYGIAAEHGTVRELVQAFRTQGNLCLEDLKKSTNKDGAWSDQRLGPAVSRRLYKVFLGRDPGTSDGMS
jgi:crossover junction endonuclease EME1